MAGHSKWANIQHRKGKQDAKRGKVFTRLIREVTIAAREGGGDPDANPRLRLAIEKAKAANMPNDNIDRAIKKATGELAGVDYEEIRYEGYAPGGVAVMVDCVTDNRNRTVAEVRHTFTKAGGTLGTEGSVAFQFDKVGTLVFGPDADEDTVMMAALDAGAEDVQVDQDGVIEVITTPEDFAAVQTAMRAAELQPEEAEVTMKPQVQTECDAEQGRKILDFIDKLEDLDDTQNVYHNADIPAASYEH